LWIPSSDPKHILWYGRSPSLEWCRERFDVDEVRWSADLKDCLGKVIGEAQTLFVLHEQTPPLLKSLREKLVVDHEHLQPAIDRARVVKTDYEVELLRHACDISSEAHRSVLRRFKSLQNECEVEAIFRAVSLAHGAKRQAYGLIAGSGVNASTLHYVKNDEALAGRQLLVLDAGCEWNCYASDITRTLPISGSFTSEAKAIYDIVENMQAVCLAGVKQGALFHDLHVRAHLNAAAGLLQLGLLQGATPHELVSNGTSAAFFPHGLGHHVGLEVHDVTGRESLLYMPALNRDPADCGTESDAPQDGLIGKRQWFSPEMLSYLVRNNPSSGVLLPMKGHIIAGVTQLTDTRSPAGLSWILGRRLLEKNMVITVEPGIYFCREYLEAYFKGNPQHDNYINWDLLEQYYPVGGVRIEDTVLVTETGVESLSTAPKGQEALDIINADSTATRFTAD
jgi:Xaa-Pro dipeptidase